MSWFDRFRSGRKRRRAATPAVDIPLALERLESRTLLDATATLANGMLTILGGPHNDRINVCLDPSLTQLLVSDGGRVVGRFASAAVNSISIDSGTGLDVVRVDNNVLQPTVIKGEGSDVFYAGGGPTTLIGGPGQDKLIGGPGPTTLIGGPTGNHLLGGSGPTTFVGGSGPNLFYNLQDIDQATGHAGDRVVTDPFPPAPPAAGPAEVLNTNDVAQLLARAAAADSHDDAIVAVVDRAGNILGVRVEGNVSPAITSSSTTLTFAIDGAVSLARTGAFFANSQAPLTSRTIQFISQSTITQREVDSSPDVGGPASPLYGPGFVAPVGTGAHFPPNVPFTPAVDLFGIEDTNRDSILQTGPDGIRDSADALLPSRFNIPVQYLPGGAGELPPPESYGYDAFPASNPAHFAQSRGIATLPGGIPIYKDGTLVGGIGVFFPGSTGFASEENSSLSNEHDPNRPDRSLEAEYVAFAAVGGSSMAQARVGNLGGILPLPGFDLPFGRIDLAGITLPLFGPPGQNGPASVLAVGATLGMGNPSSGTNVPLDTGGTVLRDGQSVPDGQLVTSHDGIGQGGVNLTAADVNQIIIQGILQAEKTRAQIRTPPNVPARMVIAISDLQGNIIGLYRMADATVFSIDVAVAKARNVAYYANPDELQPIDQLPGVPAGAALTNRTFRYLAGPRYPEGSDGFPPGPFSILNDGGADPLTGLTVGPPLPGTAFQSVLGHDAFFPDTNFHDPFNPNNQNGVVFFPGSLPLYKNGILVGGLGVSGDGVNEDDVVTAFAAMGFQPPDPLHADQFFFANVRLPYLKFNRNPTL